MSKYTGLLVKQPAVCLSGLIKVVSQMKMCVRPLSTHPNQPSDLVNGLCWVFSEMSEKEHEKMEN